MAQSSICIAQPGRPPSIPEPFRLLSIVHSVRNMLEFTLMPASRPPVISIPKMDTVTPAPPDRLVAITGPEAGLVKADPMITVDAAPAPVISVKWFVLLPMRKTGDEKGTDGFQYGDRE